MEWTALVPGKLELASPQSNEGAAYGMVPVLLQDVKRNVRQLVATVKSDPVELRAVVCKRHHRTVCQFLAEVQAGRRELRTLGRQRHYRTVHQV